MKISLLCSRSTYDDPRLIRYPNDLFSRELLLGLYISSLDQLGPIRFDICFGGTLLALYLLEMLWLFVCCNATSEFTYITNKRPLKETGKICFLITRRQRHFLAFQLQQGFNFEELSAEISSLDRIKKHSEMSDRVILIGI